MTKFGSVLAGAALALMVGTAPALAQHHGGGNFHGGGWHGGGWHGGGWGGWGIGFGPWWGYPAYYGYPYAYDPYDYSYSAQVAAPAAPPPAQSTWYYCPTSKAYYPYVSSCSVQWQQVPAQPQ